MNGNKMISAVIHTYNEEKNIERCLSSLSWADEIVIIDMGSRDKTLDIAKSFKAKIYEHPYTGFVEPARNFGLSKAKGDWILVVDADEEIPKSLAHFLSLEVQHAKYDFYRIARKNIIFNKWIKHAGWWPDCQIRFFKRGAVNWTEKVHGIPLTRGSGTDLEAIEDLSLIHYNYQSIEQFLERLNRYTSISAKELFISNRKFSHKDLFEVPAREFINRYFLWEGYKDGVHGLVLSLLQSFSELSVFLKLWDLEDFKEERISLEQTSQLINREYKEKKYWVFKALLKQTNNIFLKALLKIKSKINQYV